MSTPQTVIFTLLISVLLFANGQMNETCGPTTDPVAGGVDFVDLLEGYKANNNQLQPPNMGSSQFSATINDYTFLFMNATNLDKFKASSTEYIPKYGCFCAWARSGFDTHCPNPPNEYGCFAPLCQKITNGYAIIENEIYCFLESVPRQNFMDNGTQAITSSDKDWKIVTSQLKKDVNNCFNTNDFNVQQPACSQ